MNLLSPPVFNHHRKYFTFASSVFFWLPGDTHLKCVEPSNNLRLYEHGVQMENQGKVENKFKCNAHGYRRGMLALSLNTPLILEAGVKGLSSQMMNIEASVQCVSKISLG